MFRQEADGRVVHPYERVMFVLALLVVPVVLIEASKPSRHLRDIASGLNWLIWVGFLTEFVAIMIVAERKRAAVRAHLFELGVVLVTTPLLPIAFSALRMARLLRLLRLARLGLLGARALRAERVLSSRQGFRYVALATALLVMIAGAVISVVDTRDFKTVGVGVWWAIVTVTTVGYGDVYPTTVAGRMVAAGLMLVGIGFVAALTASIASSFVAADANKDERDRKDNQQELLDALGRIEARLERLETRLET